MKLELFLNWRGVRGVMYGAAWAQQPVPVLWGYVSENATGL